ncbi:DUF6226 family protein [Pseudarthrobacter sp. So.54]
MDSHPERFVSLHAVARALIDHLTAVYDVDVQDDPVLAEELLMRGGEVLQAVKLTPRDSGAASLTFMLTGYPGVMVHAGVLHDFPFPSCGCDACDETVETVADRLEMLVLTVAVSGYSERYPVGRQRWSEYALTAVDGSGSESGRGEPGPLTAARLHDAELRLREAVSRMESLAAARELTRASCGLPERPTSGTSLSFGPPECRTRCLPDPQVQSTAAHLDQH